MKNTRKKAGITNTSDFDYEASFGKIPPHDTAAEKAVLGACMLVSDAYAEVSTILTAEAFYSEAHAIVFRAISELAAAGRPMDLITVSNQLQAMGQLNNVGGPFALTELTGNVGSSANIEFHARIVLEAWVKREMIRMGSMFISGGYDTGRDPLEDLNGLSMTIDKIYELLQSGKMPTWKSMMQSAVNEIEAKTKSPSRLAGISTGFQSVDAVTGGRCNGDLIILAARPSAGKTTRMLQEVINMIQRGIPVGVVSVEMAAMQVIVKMISNLSKVNSEQIRRGQLNETEIYRIKKYGAELERYPMHLVDISTINIFQLRVLARNWKKKFGIKALFVDYLQLLKGDPDSFSRDQEVGSISRGLKQIAKELDIPVIALSQLSRAVDSRPKKEPMLSDLRESGNIEQDADVVEFLYRPDYYGITEDEDGNDIRGIVKEIVAKNRNGGLDTTKLKFIPQISCLMDIEADTKNNDSGYFPAANTLPPNESADINQEDIPF